MLDFTAALVALALGAAVFILITASTGADPGWGAAALIAGAAVGVWIFKNRK
jgi:hypothetical protein